MILKGKFKKWNIKDCCDKLIVEVLDSEVIKFLDNKPYTTDEGISNLYVVNDGNSKSRCESINYCPFCGTKIEITEWIPKESQII